MITKPPRKMNREKLTIKGKAYEVGFSFRAIREYEILTGASIENCRTSWDFLIYLYATLKALNKDFALSLDDFIEAMDENPRLLADFQTLQIEAEAPTPAAPDPAQKKSTIKSLFSLWMLFGLLAVSPLSLPIIFGMLWIGTSWKLLAKLIAKAGKKRACHSLRRG